MRALVELWQKRLQLDRWEIEYLLDELDEDNERPANKSARIWLADDHYCAKLWLGPDWREWSGEYMERTIVHELLHLSMRHVEFVLTQVAGQVNRDAYSAIRQTFFHHVEGFIDHLSWRIVDLAPAATRGD